MTQRPSPYILLVDCNNFYVSCERLFQPKLAREPVVVLAGNDGCIIARSQEAKDLHLTMSMPLFKIPPHIRRKLTVFSSNFPLYADISHRLIQLLENEGLLTENYSIDESFMQMPAGTQEDPYTYAVALRSKIAQHIGIPVSIGIAHTKTQAKLANHIAKQHRSGSGVYALTDIHHDQKALERPIEAIWGVGHRQAEKLRAIGVRTVRDFMALPNPRVKQRFNVTLARTHLELHHQQALTCESQYPPKQTILCSRTYKTAQTHRDEIQSSLADHAASAMKRLRKQQGLVKTLHIFLESSRFQEGQTRRVQTLTLEQATDDDRIVLAAVLKACHSLYDASYTVKRSGILLLEIVPISGNLDLFYAQPPTADELMKTLDTINAKYGNRTLFMAAQGANPPKREEGHKSPGYTTNWADLLTIKI